jgi:hypothetical protein
MYFLQGSGLRKLRKSTKKKGKGKPKITAMTMATAANKEDNIWWTKYYASREVILFIDATEYLPLPQNFPDRSWFSTSSIHVPPRRISS